MSIWRCGAKVRLPVDMVADAVSYVVEASTSQEVIAGLPDLPTGCWWHVTQIPIIPIAELCADIAHRIENPALSLRGR